MRERIYTIPFLPPGLWLGPAMKMDFHFCFHRQPKAPLRPPTTGPMAKMFTAGPLRTGGENTGRENNLCSGDREKALPIMIDGELLSPPLHVRHGHNQMMVEQFPIILSQINCATISGRGRGRGRGHRDQTARGLIMGSSLGSSAGDMEL